MIGDESRIRSMCSFHPWAQLDRGRAAGLNPLEDCRPETGSWWWSSRAGLVAASSSPPLPWHQSHHALHPSHLPSELPNLPSHWSIRATTGTSNQRRGQLFPLCLPLTFQMPLKNLPLHLAWHWQDQHCKEASGHSRLCDK